MRRFEEITGRPGAPVEARCKDDNNIYVLLSDGAKEVYNRFLKDYGRYPSRPWFYYNLIRFKRVKHEMGKD